MENVEIVDLNGNVIVVEPVLYFKILATGKKYLFYTLNEEVEGLVRVYYTQATDSNEPVGVMSDEEKASIKDIMTKIVGNGDLSNIEFLPLPKGDV